MDKEFFNLDMRLFIDQRVDWERYYKLRHGDSAGTPCPIQGQAILHTQGSGGVGTRDGRTK